VRVAVVGVSTTSICGVRDHATLLAQALPEQGVECSIHWLSQDQGSLRAELAAVRAWTGRLPDELRAARAEAVLLHYSVFAHAHRGLPIYAPPLLAALRAARLPVIAIVHEAAYPWGLGGPRGALWAFTQRLALVDLMRTSAGVLVTADFRAGWLASRRWLPQRPIEVAPVFSNLPAPTAQRDAHARSIGLFGYAYEGAGASLVLDALRLLSDRGDRVALRLLGAPGREAPAARAWLAAARERGVADSLSFTGTLSPHELSDALARCGLLLFIGAGGPSSRKGTLAGSLASGRPVVALDGPRRWPELVEEQALRLVPANAAALAAACGELLDDPAAADALGARGRAFAESRMGVQRTAVAVRELLDAVR
jgi:glycosyltransferase involved in cell wall biosynthesis